MSSEYPRTTDFAQVASLILEAGGSEKLRKIAQRALAAQSCDMDLQLAFETVGIWQRDQSRFGSSETSSNVLYRDALMTASTIAYARATSTNGETGERGGFDIRKTLKTTVDREDHQRILDVRNQVIAHVYPDRVVSGSIWHETRFAGFEQSDGGWLPGCLSRRITGDDGHAKRLMRMIPIAQHIVRAGVQKRLTRFATELQAEAERINLEPLFERCLFDAGEFVGSDAVARSAIQAAGLLEQ